MAKQSPSAAKKLIQGVIVLLIIAALLTVINERSDEPQAVEIRQETATAPAPTPTQRPTALPPTPTRRPTVLPPTAVQIPTDADITPVPLDSGRGFIGDWWRVYFNHVPGDPSGSGLDTPLTKAIAAVRHTLDIAAFEMNHERIVTAILDAHQRGVRVRIVTDDQHGLEDEKDDALRRLQAAGIPVVDDARSALMHNKFMIMDSAAVWTGSWNYTFNGAYRNNNNVFVMENKNAAAAYQAEFDEMFIDREFGVRSSNDGIISFSQSGTDIRIIFAAEADEIPALAAEIKKAKESIRIMVFVFSLDELAESILEAMDAADIRVQGIFEKRNSAASWSQMPRLHCAGAQMRQDGNRYTLHHKVFIIDDHTVITGSFNFSNNAAKNNDENIVIVRNSAIASRYLEEWRRLWDGAESLRPDEVVCP